MAQSDRRRSRTELFPLKDKYLKPNAAFIDLTENDDDDDDDKDYKVKPVLEDEHIVQFSSPIPRKKKVEVVVPRLETIKAYRRLFKSPDSKRLKLEPKVEPLPLNIKLESGEMADTHQNNEFTYKVRELYNTTDAQDIKVAISGLHNPDFKFKKDAEIPSDSVYRRLQAIGLDWFPINGLTDEQKYSSVNRDFMSKTYGGNTQTMFPKIDAGKLAKHGFDELSFLNLDFNPHAPQHPGAPGLFFAANPEWRGPMTKRVFVRMDTSKWLYVGMYKFVKSDPLTAKEFSELGTKVKDTWAKDTKSKTWGHPIIARIHLRAQNNGREPSEAQVTQALTSDDTLKTMKAQVTHRDVINAFMSGKENIGVSCMKCIEYNATWQAEMIQKYADFMSALEAAKREGNTPKASKGQKKKKPTAKPAKRAAPRAVRVGQKRKVIELSDSESDSELNE